MKKVLVIFLTLVLTLSLSGLGTMAIGGMGMEKARSEGIITKQIVGEIKAVDLNEKYIVVKSDKGDFTVTFGYQTIIKKGADMKTPVDLKIGNKVTVRYMAVEDRNVARSIIINPEGTPRETK
ncbi:MAG: hypothetical protein AB1638_03860 [Nitrospirota bacterium]